MKEVSYKIEKFESVSFKSLINGIDKNDKKMKTEPEMEKLANEFEIYDWLNNDERLEAYYISVWQCTDTWVGTTAYFLDGEFVLSTNQMYRKGDTTIAYASKEAYLKIKEYIFSLADKKEDNFVLIGNMEDKIDSYYEIQYSSQILHKHAYYQIEIEGVYEWVLVEITKTYNDYVKFHEVEIQLPSGKKVEVDCRELRFKYNTRD